jgi:DNA-binding XRE family transcriptional regulator
MAATLHELSNRLRARHELPPPELRRALRKAAGASQADIAEVVGVTRQSVSFWEAGTRTPRGPNLESYVDVLEVLRGAVSEGAGGPNPTPESVSPLSRARGSRTNADGGR